MEYTECKFFIIVQTYRKFDYKCTVIALSRSYLIRPVASEADNFKLKFWWICDAKSKFPL